MILLKINNKLIYLVNGICIKLYFLYSVISQLIPSVGNVLTKVRLLVTKESRKNSKKIYPCIFFRRSNTTGEIIYVSATDSYKITSSGRFVFRKQILTSYDILSPSDNELNALRDLFTFNRNF